MVSFLTVTIMTSTVLAQKSSQNLMEHLSSLTDVEGHKKLVNFLKASKGNWHQAVTLKENSILYADPQKSLRLENLDQISSEERRDMILNSLSFAFGPILNLKINQDIVTNAYEKTLENITNRPLFRSYYASFRPVNERHLNSIYSCHLELGSKVMTIDHCSKSNDSRNREVLSFVFEKQINEEIQSINPGYVLSSVELLKLTRSRLGSSKKDISVVIEPMVYDASSDTTQSKSQKNSQVLR